MMIQVRRGEGGEGLSKQGWTLAGCVVVAGASGNVTAVLDGEGGVVPMRGPQCLDSHALRGA
ncbi:hypothetical protein IWX64_002631 [Arthrobacter sp. CAN_A212]|nr:hypothetical protein [Arthrobacter sp. CAN_C5]